MGDDELNFTEEEAGCWADELKSQAQDDSVFLRLMVTISLLIVVGIVILALSSGISSSPAGKSYSGLFLCAWGAGSARPADGCDTSAVVSRYGSAVSMSTQ